MSHGRLEGRIALITGGSRGIGAAIAVEGATVGLLHLGDRAGQGLVAEIAPTAVLLASDDGAFVGQTLSPNGGDVML
jgi:3(or 17)beta-hydroxysteroid dehydrogenase